MRWESDDCREVPQEERQSSINLAQCLGYEALIEAVRTQGYGLVELTALQCETLRRVEKEALRFFARNDKDAFHASTAAIAGIARRTVGYRPFQYAHSGNPNLPDYNESFIYKASEMEMIPNMEGIKPFVSALAQWHLIGASIANGFHRALEVKYGVLTRPPDFRGNLSITQCNRTPCGDPRQLSQQAHIDHTYLTGLCAWQPGLEIEIKGEMQPLTPGRARMLIFGGGLLGDITPGNDFNNPLRHQVRMPTDSSTNGRISVMCFLNPSVEGLLSYAHAGRGVDFNALASRRVEEAFDNPL